MKASILFEQEEETEEEIIELGRFVRMLLKTSGGQRSYALAVDFLRDNPELNSDLAAVALEALGKGRLEDYYNHLKRQNKDLARYF